MGNHPEITGLFAHGGIFPEGNMRLAMYRKLTNQLPNDRIFRNQFGSSRMDDWKNYTFYLHPNYDETKLIILHTPMPKKDGNDRRWIIYHTEKGALYECRIPNRLANHRYQFGPKGLRLKPI